MADEHTPAESAGAQHDEQHSDTVVLLGRTITVYGGIYTVVFGALAVMTLVEVVLGSISGNWTIPLLLVLAGSKATLVVLYYMHLKTDSRIFAYTLLVPLAIALLSVLYLMGVPPTGYSVP